MEKPRVLSGDALVAKGITKIDASLPEVGLKDVMPNGSWLEQKQIQAALEARKYLIEVERIEKCGTLSHAEWRDDLMLAEVTQKAGGHWQYLGHNVGKTLYLRPEEALFLMEVNCLLLKHNEVTVSLQKAYSLLLSSSATMIQYKVYSSLSRLGYRVFRHTGPKVNDEKKKTDSQKVNKDDSNVNAPIIIMHVDSKLPHTPTADPKKSVDSLSTGKLNEKVVSPTVSTVESENDAPIVSTQNNTETVGSPIVAKVNESENDDSSVVNPTVKTEKAESGVPIDNTVSDSKSDNYPIVHTVPDSEILDTPKDDFVEIDNTVSDSKSDNSLIVDIVLDAEIVDTPKNDTLKKSKNQGSPITNKVSENEQTTDQDENKSTEIKGDNIVEPCEVNGGEVMAEKLNAENSITKEIEIPNVMEVDETIELKTADISVESETNQEVSSTMTEINKTSVHATESMKICTNNQEILMDIVLVEESDLSSNSIEVIPAEEPNSMATSDLEKVVDTSKAANDAVSAINLEIEGKDTGTQNIEVSTKCLEKVPNNIDPSNSNICTSTANNTKKVNICKNHEPYSYLKKIEMLTERQLKPSDSKSMDKFFENFPDFSKGRVATVNIPEQKFIPKNIFVNKATYTLNLENIKMRSNRSVSSETPAYTSSDEVNGNNIRRIRSSLDVLGSEYPQNPNMIPHVRFPNFPRFQNFRPYAFWRPQNNLNIYQLMFFQTRFQYHQRPHLMARPPCFNINTNNLNMHSNVRKRMRSGKFDHFQGIRNLAIRLKHSLISGNTNMANLEALHRSIHSYNLRYKTRLRLNETFDVINDEKIVETIDLDDDEESKSKKPRLEKDDDDKFDENLYRLRQLALRLRDLEAKDEATASHRRAFSKAIKTFNKSYNADIYLDDVNYEVIDKRFITLDSSSESDCVVEEKPKVRSKKLKNPFNILKRRKERLQSLNRPGTSKDNSSSGPSQTDPSPAEADGDNSKYSEFLHKTFNKTWLPNEDDFGRAEVVPKSLMKSRLEFSKEQFLYEYKNDQVQNWLEAKISFLRYLEETNIAFKRELERNEARIQADVEMCNTGLKPLIDFEDSSDMPSVLEKLRIIENNKEIEVETSLRIDFDVYNRNVQNFRKKNPPKPHFRIICLDESAGIPSAAQVMSLHSKYEDNVPIVFAIVSIGSISYLQINPLDLPIYVPTTNDIV